MILFPSFKHLHMNNIDDHSLLALAAIFVMGDEIITTLCSLQSKVVKQSTTDSKCRKSQFFPRGHHSDHKALHPHSTAWRLAQPQQYK